MTSLKKAVVAYMLTIADYYAHSATVIQLCFAFSPTAILDHFDMNHKKCLEVLLLKRDENRIFDSELADFRLHKSQHDAMEKLLHTSIIALRDENIVLKEDASAFEETNHELYEHCLLLNQAICAKFAEVKKMQPKT